MEEKKQVTVEQVEIEARRSTDKVNTIISRVNETISDLCETIKILANENRDLKKKLETAHGVDVDQK